MGKILRKTYLASETKAANEDRTLIVKISTSTPDRSNDIVRPEGVLLDNYLRNPVVAFGHNYSGLSIGKTIDVQKVDDGIVAKVEFAPKGVYPLADQLYEMYKGGFMNAWSIGFIPKKWIDKQDGGRDFQEWELLEYSAVLVPDNPEALTLLRSHGVDVEPLELAMKSFKEEETIEEKEESNIDPIDSEIESQIKTVFELIDQSGDEVEMIELNHKEKTITILFASDNKYTFKMSEKYNEDLKKVISTEDRISAILLVDALKIADQVIGRALRDYRKGQSGTGQVPDDRRLLPIVRRKEEVDLNG